MLRRPDCCVGLAESFVNLLIFVLAKPEIKQDEQRYQDIIRSKIHTRVNDLHLNCQGFTSPIDVSAKAVKDFQTLMNHRNDFLHGNVDPHRLKYDVVHFDGIIPLPGHYQDFAELALINSLLDVKPEAALRDIDTVDRFIEFVLTHLASSVRHEVELLMNTFNHGWREDTKRVGVLFPPHIVYGMLGPPIDP